MNNCGAGYIQGDTNMICIACPGLVCSGCSSPYYLKGTSCVTDCGSGYFENSNTNTCDQCPGYCSVCTSGSACSSCIPGP